MMKAVFKNNFLVFMVLLTTGLCAYAPSFGAPLQLDDVTVIKDNHVIQKLDIPQIFRFDPSRFITHLSFALNYSLHKTQVIGYHAINFLLHVLNAFLVFLFLDRILSFHSKEDTRVWSFLGALIFICHPIQTSAVTYVVQRSVLIATVCYIGALLLYIRLRISFSQRDYVCLWIIILVGVMSKPIIFTLPLTALLLEWVYLHSYQAEKRVWLWIPLGCVLFAVPLLLLGFFTNSFGLSFGLDNFSLATKVSHDIPRLQYLYTQFFVWLRYFQLLCFPLQQSIYHVVDLAQGFTDARTLVSVSCHVVLLISGMLTARRNPVFIFALVWFYILMIPEGSVFPLPDIMFEHRLYIVMVPFVLVIVAFARSLKEFKKLSPGIVMVLVVGCGFLSFQRNLLWTDTENLLLEFSHRYPASAKPYNNLGIHYLRQGRFSKAEESFQKAITRNPTYAPAVLNMGRTYAKQENWPAAEKYFNRALQLDPFSYDVLVNLGDYYFRTNQAKQSIVHYQKALKIKPTQAYPPFKIGEVYLLSGRAHASVDFFKASLKVNPNYEPAQYMLGNAYIEQRKYGQAVETFQTLLQQNPTNKDVYNAMGVAYVQQDMHRAAEQAFLKALSLDPDNYLYYVNLSQLYDKQGDKERSVIYQKMADKHKAAKGSSGK